MGLEGTLEKNILARNWTKILQGEQLEIASTIAGVEPKLVAVVVPVRGRWWGLCVVRCDEASLSVLAVRCTGRATPVVEDELLERIGCEMAAAVRETVDVTAVTKEAIVLREEQAAWAPPHARRLATLTFLVGGAHVFIVEVHERLRADRRPGWS